MVDEEMIDGIEQEPTVYPDTLEIFSGVQLIRSILTLDPTLQEVFMLEISEELRKGNLDRSEYQRLQEMLKLVSLFQILLANVARGKHNGGKSIHVPYFLYKQIYQTLALSGSKRMGYIRTLLTRFYGKYENEEKRGLFKR